MYSFFINKKAIFKVKIKTFLFMNRYFVSNQSFPILNNEALAYHILIKFS